MQDSINTQQPDMPVSEEIEAVMSLLSGEPEKAETPAPEKDETPEAVTAEPEKEEVAAEDAPEKAEDGNDAPEKDAIDYGMQVPITGGEPVTLGELKDLYQNQQAAKLELIERENTMFRAVEQSSELLNYVAQLPPQVVQAAQANIANEHRKQAGILSEILPEVRTDAGVKAVRDALLELGAEYNLQPHDIDQIKNAVTIKMMHDFARLKAGIKAAKENVKPLRSTDPKPVAGVVKPTSELQQLTAQAKRTRNPQDEANAVAALLRSA